MQSRWQSILETTLNTGTGFCMAWILTLYVLPLYGFDTTVRQAWEITFIFTVVSVIRGYLWRRIFNRIQSK